MIRLPLVCLIAGLAPVSAMARDIHCDYVLRCTGKDADTCVTDSMEASVMGVDTEEPRILAMDEAIPVSLHRINRDRQTATFAGETLIGGAESLTVNLSNGTSTYAQNFTLDDGPVTQVFHGNCVVQ